MLLVKICEIFGCFVGVSANAAFCEEDIYIYVGTLHLAVTE